MTSRASWLCIALVLIAHAAKGDDVPADKCIVDLKLPPGTLTSVGGGAFGKFTKLEWDGLKPGSVTPYDVRFRFADGSTADRTVWIDAGRRYPLVLQGPKAVRPKLQLRLGHADDINHVAYGPDCELLASSDYDGVVIVWNCRTGHELFRVQHDGGYVETLRFSPDASKLIVVGERSSSAWSVPDGIKASHPGAVEREGTTNDLGQSRRVIDSKHQRAAIWDGSSLKDVDLKTGTPRWESFGQSPVVLKFPAVSGLPIVMQSRRSVRLVDPASQQVVKDLLTLDDESNRITNVDVHSVAKSVVIATQKDEADQQLYLVDLTSNQLATRSVMLEGSARAREIKVSRDGRKALSSFWNGDFMAVVVWDLQTGKTIGVHQPKRLEDAIYCAEFAADNQTVILGRHGSTTLLNDRTPPFQFWNPNSGRINPFGTMPPPLPGMFSAFHAAAMLCISSDGQTIVSCGHTSGMRANQMFGTCVWNANGTLRSNIEVGLNLGTATYGPTSNVAAINTNNQYVDFINPESGIALRKIEGQFNSFAVNDRLVSMSDGDWNVGASKLVDLKSGDEVLRLIRFANGKDWIAVTPEGLFDGSEQGRQQVAFRVGDSPELVAVDRFFQDFYRPGLVTAVLNGKRPLPETDFAAQAAPQVVIESPSADSETVSEQTTVTIRVNDQGGGVKGPWLMHNGVRLADEGERQGEDKEFRQTFRVKLTPGENLLEAHAASGDGSWESEPARISIRLNRAAAKPAIHLVAVGVDKYAAETMNLRFAAADAKAVAELFAKRGPALYGDERVRVTTVLDEQATAAGIRSAVEKLAGQCNPQDTIVVFLAGHGMTVGQRYYFIPHELKHSAERFEDDIRRDGLPVDVLNDWIGKSPALKRVLILDTCQSGSALSLLGGGSRDPFAFRGALERLSFATGTFTIAAAPAGADAQELTDLKHGLLTYTLLAAVGAAEGGPLANQKLKPSGDANVAEVREWFSYAQDKVPLLSKLYLGQEQFVGFCGQGTSFPLLPLNEKN